MSSTKYYFGYISFHGQLSPLTWVEHNGNPIGGKIHCTPTNKHEITERDFNGWSLEQLKLGYPPVV